MVDQVLPDNLFHRPWKDIQPHRQIHILLDQRICGSKSHKTFLHRAQWCFQNQATFYNWLQRRKEERLKSICAIFVPWSRIFKCHCFLSWYVCERMTKSQNCPKSLHFDKLAKKSMKNSNEQIRILARKINRKFTKIAKKKSQFWKFKCEN